MTLPRVILADDHILVAEALQQLIAPYFDVVATVADGHALVDATLSLKPDVVVVDVAMPLLNGLEAGRQLKAKTPSLKLIFVTMNGDPNLAVEAIRLGASGYLLKTSAGSELLQAIRVALQGKRYITRQIARDIEECFIRHPDGGSHRTSLSPRQTEVVQLLAEGKSLKEAGNVLHLTPRAIAFHKYNVMQELGLKTNADLIKFAVKRHIGFGWTQ
jgi:DNA-binding NarL/FixJ family response regulator